MKKNSNEERMSRKKAIICSIMAIVILLVSEFLSSIPALLLQMAGIPSMIGIVLNGFLYISLTLVLVKLFFGKIMHLDMAGLGLTRFSVKPKWLLAGFLLPIAVMAVYLLLLPGEYVSSGMERGEILETLGIGIFCTGFGAGFVEEIVFRGVIFHSLRKAFNSGVGVILPSVLFGIVHILGMDFSLGSCMLVILAGTAAGIMFSVITIESGSVWSNALVHSLWNIIVIGGGVTVALQPSENSVMTYIPANKSFIVTGGDFGIESSAISLIAYIAVIVIALMMMKKKTGAEENGI